MNLTSLFNPLFKVDNQKKSAPSNTPKTNDEKFLKAARDEKSEDRQIVRDAYLAYKELAESGMPEAMYPLAVMLLEGRGCKEDAASAVQWFKTAAAQEHPHPKAFYYLGSFYEQGKVVSQDREVAFQYYLMAFCSGNLDAKEKLQSWLIGDGACTSDELQCAFNEIEKVVNKQSDLESIWPKPKENPDHSPIMARLVKGVVNLADHYRWGKNIFFPKNEKKAIALYEMAAEIGSKEACTKLSDVLTKEGPEQNVPQGRLFAAQAVEIGRHSQQRFEFYQQAALTGNSAAIDYIGLAYQQGTGVARNPEKSFICFAQAITKGNQRSLSNLQSLLTSDSFNITHLKQALLVLKNPSQYPDCFFAGFDQKSISQGLAKVAQTLKLLADEYRSGSDKQKQNEPKAVQLYEMADLLGSVDAAISLVEMHEQGKGAQQDQTSAYELNLRMAKTGNAAAIHNLGVAYQEGNGVAQDIEQAIRCYIQAICQGNVNARSKLKSLMLGDGFGVAHLKNALLFMERSAQQFDLDGVFVSYNKAKFYRLVCPLAQSIKENADQCRRVSGASSHDFVKAAKLYEIAVELDHPQATSSLAEMLEKGKGVAKDATKALQLYQRAADIAENKVLAFEYSQLDAKLGDADAMNYLGFAYRHGIGVAQNNEKALLCWIQALAKGESTAGRRIKHLLSDDKFDIQSLKNALFILKNATQPKNSDCVFIVFFDQNRARFYKEVDQVAGAIKELGDGYSSGDAAKAVKFYQIATELNHADGIHALAYMSGEGKGVQQDQQQACELYRRAAKLGSKKSMNNLGLAYEYGLGVPQSDKKAALCYIQGICKGNPKSLTGLRNLLQSKLSIEDLKSALDALENPTSQQNIFIEFDKALFYREVANLAMDFKTSGDNYRYGKNDVEPSKARAVQCYEFACELGNIEAATSLAHIYYQEQGNANQQQKTFNLFQKVARSGERNSLHNLGILYRDGYGVASNLEKAVMCHIQAIGKGQQDSLKLLKALLIGDSFSAKQLQSVLDSLENSTQPSSNAGSNAGSNSDCIFDGYNKKRFIREVVGIAQEIKEMADKCQRGKRQDINKAVKLYAIADKLGNVDAALSLGDLFDHGKAVTVDKKKAFEFYLKAAKAGNASAISNLGVAYQHGAGIPQHREKAMTCYLQAICTGNKAALTHLERLLSSPDADLNQFHQILHSLIKSNQLTHTDCAFIQYDKALHSAGIAMLTNALCDIAGQYKSGKGLAQKYPEKAIQLYKMAIELGSNEATFKLGNMHFLGQGIEEDSVKAFELFLQAAKTGNSSALTNLGVAYQTGDGVQKNIAKAILCYVQAIWKNSQTSEQNLHNLLISDGFDIKHLKVALAILEKPGRSEFELLFFKFDRAAFYQKFEKLAQTIYKLADDYLKGTGQVQQNKEKAYQLFEIAAEFGNVDASSAILEKELSS